VSRPVGRLRPGPLLRDTVDAFLIATLGWLPLFAGPSYGFSISTAGVILAIMILPTMVSIGREVLRSVPTHSARPCSDGSHALGGGHEVSSLRPLGVIGA